MSTAKLPSVVAADKMEITIQAGGSAGTGERTEGV